MTTTRMTPTQHAVLAYAVEHTGGKIDWFPDNIKGGARKKVIDGLLGRALITTGGTDWIVAAGGYDALNVPRPGPVLAPQGPQKAACAADDDAALEADVAAAESAFTRPAAPRAPRPNSKTATLMALLGGDGACMADLCAATGWQPHSVRGFLANLRKRLPGHQALTSAKTPGKGSVYRLERI